MGGRTAGLIVAALILTGCDGASGDEPIVATSATTTASSVPTASPSSSLQPSASPSRSRTYQPPTIDLDCPDDFSYPWGSSTTVNFGYQWNPGTQAVVSWSMLYGDGDTYTSETAEDAEANLFWHVYDEPGTYQVTAIIADMAGPQAATTSCTFTYTWTGSAAPPQPSGGGDGGYDGGYGGGGPSSGWLGCHYDGIPMWGNVKVVDFAPDVTVKVVDFASDLRVKMVEFGANSCGQWREVDFGADFTVKFVDFAADIDIEFIDFGEGR